MKEFREILMQIGDSEIVSIILGLILLLLSAFFLYHGLCFLVKGFGAPK